ncbi:hypothetical protein DITRI_Ditri03aG0027500 [Diplodiscus trichospermus]
MEFLRARWKFKNCLADDAVGRSGSLALLWSDDVSLAIQSFSKNHIDAGVLNDDGLVSWRITGFYGDPITGQRYRSWDLLRTLVGQSSLPWLCMGDFNEIVSSSEKLGGAILPESQMSDFRDVLMDCGSFELPVIGCNFTWARGEGDDAVFERLDRCIVTDSWLSLFPQASEVHLVHSYSDHCPLLVRLLEASGDRINGIKPIRFEDIWLKYDGCREVICSGWNLESAYSLDEISNKLASSRDKLVVWSGAEVGNIKMAIFEKENELN